MTPVLADDRSNSSMMSGKATPTMKTINPSKNFPADASSQIRRCIAVVAPALAGVPSLQSGTSSMYCWTVEGWSR
ncbi:hypothetical protein [Williamsia limnetica]|nr:hypothetical protein [Williamsia limnetica]